MAHNVHSFRIVTSTARSVRVVVFLLVVGAAPQGCAEARPNPSTPVLSNTRVGTTTVEDARALPTTAIAPSEALVAACALSVPDAARAPKFEFDRSALSATDVDVLGQIARCLTTGPLAGRSVDLVGRADPRGGEEYNTELGLRRAASVHASLSRSGVGSDHLFSSSRGKTDAIGIDEVGWSRDRRVDIVLR